MSGKYDLQRFILREPTYIILLGIITYSYKFNRLIIKIRTPDLPMASFRVMPWFSSEPLKVAAQHPFHFLLFFWQ
jgi:hypothetical protein